MTVDLNSKVPIAEIFRSLEGEGSAIGTPTIFIRIAGCNVGCKFCDSKHTWSGAGFPKMTIPQIVKAVEALQRGKSWIRRISITGGEPLLHADFVLQLVDSLMNSHALYTFNLETSGTIFPARVFEEDYFESISLDIKTPTSGVVLSEAHIYNIRKYARLSNVYVKAIVGAKKDLDFVLDEFDISSFNSLVLTPCEVKGKFFSIDSIYRVLNQRRINFAKMPLRIIAQQHKLLQFR